MIRNCGKSHASMWATFCLKCTLSCVCVCVCSGAVVKWCSGVVVARWVLQWVVHQRQRAAEVVSDVIASCRLPAFSHSHHLHHCMSDSASRCGSFSISCINNSRMPLSFREQYLVKMDCGLEAQL